MPDVRLSCVIGPYDRIVPLMTGEVKPEGITLEFANAPSNPNIMFYDQMQFGRYDISEMSWSSFLRGRQEGWGYRMLPVFQNRLIAYPMMTIRLASGIRPGHPEDLKGKRIALGYYQQTAGLWSRGFLLHEFGVAPEDIEWYEAPGRYIEHGGEPAFTPPPGMKCQTAPKDFMSMLREGSLDAIFAFRATGDPAFPTLFPDPIAEMTRCYQKLGFGVLPAHHTTIVRESVLEQYPWVATSLVTAFNQAKQLAMQRLRERPPSLIPFVELHMRQMESAFGSDPFVYGIRPNAKLIDLAQTFSVEQGLTRRKQSWDELMPEQVLISEDWKLEEEEAIRGQDRELVGAR